MEKTTIDVQDLDQISHHLSENRYYYAWGSMMEATICVRMVQKGKKDLDMELVLLAISYIVQGFRRSKIINMLRDYQRSEHTRDRSPLTRPPPPSKSEEVEKYLNEMKEYERKYPKVGASHQEYERKYPEAGASRHKNGKSSNKSRKRESRSN